MKHKLLFKQIVISLTFSIGLLSAADIKDIKIPEKLDDATLKATKVLWDKECAKCHGKDGAGKTKIGRKLDVLDYTDPEVQAKFKVEHHYKNITEGVEKDGKTRMKAYKDKYKEQEILNLIAYIRTFVKKK